MVIHWSFGLGLEFWGQQSSPVRERGHRARERAEGGRERREERERGEREERERRERERERLID